jgi:inosose dehydratase
MIKLGIAPIGWTNDDMPELGGDITFEQCISEMALAGYIGCEVGNKYPTEDPSLLKKFLDLRGLTICNQWFSYEFTTKPLDEVKKEFIKQLEFLSLMGAQVIGGAECGNTIHGDFKIPITQRPIATKEDWAKLTKGLNELGKLSFETYGIQLAYHHHMGTMVQTTEEVDRLLEETDEKYVNLNYDCGHFHFANEDAIAALSKYFSRTAHIHLKDVRTPIMSLSYREQLSFLQAVKNGVFTVPGDGNLDIASLINIILKNNYKGWLVVEAEQDPAKANPFEYAKKGYDYINEKLKTTSYGHPQKT